ncbi:hypothetical protein B0H10DRAFT_568297 [Mycena sp. CBHHK59/15]|nr:hypothetical protein B0H10DRAFT_568297 [Mycena sp. CBHHK59/15]
MLFRFLLKTVRVRRRPSSVVTSQSGGEGEQKLAMLVQGLQLAEKVAEASGVPYLKGAIAFALAVAQCVQGYQSSNEGLNRLALNCVELMLAITDQVKDGSGLSQRMAALVKDLCKTLEEIEKTAKDIVNRDGRTRRFFAQKDNNERLSVLHRDLSEAHLRFQTLTAIAKDAPSQSESDKVYDYSDIFLGDHYAAGEGWVAYNGVLDKSDENVIVKRYGGANRQARHEKDIQAFKERWHGNLLQYIGRSHPGAEQPYNLFRGITSDHVSTYVAQRFSENNKKGSIVALKLLRDLTNALAFTVGNTNSSSFDISKVHLNALGNFILVDLEPCLPTNKISKNDMPYWRNWQEICIEVITRW